MEASGLLGGAAIQTRGLPEPKGVVTGERGMEVGHPSPLGLAQHCCSVNKCRWPCRTQQLCSKSSGAQSCPEHLGVPVSACFREMGGKSTCKVHDLNSWLHPRSKKDLSTVREQSSRPGSAANSYSWTLAGALPSQGLSFLFCKTGLITQAPINCLGAPGRVSAR